MSHYKLLVVTPMQPTAESLAATLQPWHEYACDGVLDQYVTFQSDPKEDAAIRERWATEKVERWQAADGMIVDGHDDRLYRPATPEEHAAVVAHDVLGLGSSGTTQGGIKYKKSGFREATQVRVWHEPPGFRKVELPVSALFPGIEEFAKDADGYSLHEGKFGRWNNPNHKWDWWQVGGRYSGRAACKGGQLRDQFAWADFDAESSRKLRAEQLRASVEEALDRLKKDKGVGRAEALSLWAAHVRAWPQVAASWTKQKPMFDHVNELPPGHPTRAARDAGVLTWLGDFGANVPEAEPDPFAWAARANPLTCLAFVKEGKWHEKGSIGWFGVISNEMPDAAWTDSVEAMLASLLPTDWVTVVDCHT